MHSQFNKPVLGEQWENVHREDATPKGKGYDLGVKHPVGGRGCRGMQNSAEVTYTWGRTAKGQYPETSCGIRDAKAEVERVQFELNMEIIELQLKSQPSTPLEVREQCGVAIKEGMATVDVVVVDCTTLFEQEMELVTTL